MMDAHSTGWMGSQPALQPAAARVTPGGEQMLRRRRLIFAALNIATLGGLLWGLGCVLLFNGVSALNLAMLAACALTLPWLSIGFWNATIGFALLRGWLPQPAVDPLAFHDNPDLPIVTRTAIAMAVRNEEPAAAFGRLRAMHDELIAAGIDAHFDFHVLSDTNRPDVAALEEHMIAEWQAQSPMADRIFYRRRTDNRGYKAGNIEEFCDRVGHNYEFFLPLDADSYMSAAAIARLVRIMQAHGEIGILQSLVVGAPANALFTRVFQFGMRHGMRSYTTGSAWWTGDCGPFWGHNALVRMRPFIDHCKLPVLPGKGPLSGVILSHDQVEAVLMRRAGYHVRVLVEEGESWEENPPSLPDFIRREIRWCQGNMQYWQLLGMPGLKFVSRVQLLLAILMYLGAPGWVAFIGLGVISAVAGGVAAPAGAEPVPAGIAIGLFVAIITMSLMPKLMGLGAVLANGAESARYGGRLRVIAHGLFEIIISSLVAPVVSFAIAVFAAGLAFGKKIDWRVQARGDRAVEWREAFGTFLPQTLFGVAVLVALYATAPSVLPLAAPVLAGFLASMPLAVWTASPAVGRWAVQNRVCAIPEDLAPPAPLKRLAVGSL